LYAWIAALPVLVMEKHVLPATLACFSAGLLIYLYGMERLLNGNWYAELGFPVAVAGIVVVWACWVLWRLIKTNIWYKAAGTVLIVMLADIAVEITVNMFLKLRLITFDDIITFAAFIAIIVLLWLIGSGRVNTQVPDGKEKKEEETI
jgi:hypothetical protein